MKRICVFTGSSIGHNLEYKDAAIALGKELANREIELVYGGACIGLMGVLADSVINENGYAIGVIPEVFAEKKITHSNLNELYVVSTMHQRKAKMAELSDGFIALPGGLGTLEEMFEILTWSQLGFHEKPCGLLNINNYYNLLIEFLKNCVSQGFVRQEHSSMLLVEKSACTLLDRIQNYKPTVISKWEDNL